MSFDGEPRPCDDFNIAVPYTMLQEFPPQPQLLSVIPHQAQKMLHTLDIIFTCIDISKEYIAIGSNIGIVYLYDRINDKILKLRNQDYTDAVTCVRIVISLECMVICGSMKGSVTVFKVPFADVNEMEKFTVIGFHHTNITSLECSNNGMKFFSGDSSGLVVCTDVNHLEHYSMSRVILSETDEIVQMSYTSMMLLVSTLQKTIIYHFKENQSIQVGQKLRKCPGNFGAIFFNEDRNILYASRPGQRIWKAGFNGVIIETLILKDALSKPHQHITLLQSEDNAMKKQENFQFGPLLMFHRQYLLTWSANMLVLIHPQLRAVVASCCFVDKIVNVAVHNDEIFILQGTRKLRRIALHPEDAVISETSGSSDMLEGFLKPLEKFQQSTLPSKEELTKVFHWFKNKLHDTFVDEEKNVTVFEEKEMIDLSPKLPDIIKLNSDDCLPLQFNAIATIAPKKNKENMEIIKNENDEIVFKPKKKKNKKNRKGNTSEGSKSIPKKQILNDELNTYTLSTTIENDLENVKLCVLEPTLNYNENSQSLIETAKTGGQLSDEGNYEKYEIYQLTTVDQLESPTVESINENELNSSSNALKYSNVVDIPSSHDGIYSKTQVCSDTELAVEDTVNEHCMFDKDYSENSYPDGNNMELSVSMNSMDSSDCDIPRYGMDWVEYKAPGSLLCISISKNHIFCVDSNDKLYISDFSFLGLSWQEISRPANQVAVSPSGKIIWVLYKGSAYAACGQSKNLSEDGEWVVAARNISYIAVDDDCAWYISDCGKLITQQCLSASNPCSYPVEVPCPWTISQVACHGDVVWIVVAEGKLYYRAGITEKNKIGFSWKPIKSPQISYVSSIALSSYKTGWIVDGTGRIWFRIGVSNSMPDGVTTLWEAEGSEYLFQSYSQVHKAMSKVISGERLSNFIYGQQQVYITAGEMGVWFFKTYENLLHANQGIVIGHSWDVIVPKGTASSSKWSILSARNLSKSLGCVWCASNTGELFCFSTLSNEPIAVEMPPESTIQCLETNPESVWLLTRKGDIYIRKELNERHSQGIWWQKLNLNQLANVRLTHISCSSEIVWACGDNGKVYARVGTLNPSSGACLSQAWLSLDSNVSRPPVVKKHSMIGKQFPLPIMNSVRKKSSVIVKVYVGHKPYIVWALDDMQNTYVRDGVSSSMLFGESWVYVPGLHAKELCISNATVWALKPSGKIYRRFGITENNLSGDYWKQIPGKLTHLSVTVDDEIWGLKEESIFCHSSFPLQYCKSSAKKLSGSVSEDDWEDIVQSTEFN